VEEAIRTQGPSSLLRALKKTRATLTAFDLTTRFLGLKERLWFSPPSRQGWWGLTQVFTKNDHYQKKEVKEK